MPVTESWPDILPLPTFDGYGLEPSDGVIRTPMESGPARQRLRFTNVPTAVMVRWNLTDSEFGVFQSWFLHKGRAGATWFNVTLKSGLGMVSHEARFMGQGSAPYKAVPYNRTRWVVTSKLEVRELPVLSEDALDLALAEDIDGLLAAMSGFNALIHTTIPTNPW